MTEKNMTSEEATSLAAKAQELIDRLEYPSNDYLHLIMRLEEAAAKTSSAAERLEDAARRADSAASRMESAAWASCR